MGQFNRHLRSNKEVFGDCQVYLREHVIGSDKFLFDLKIYR